MGTYNETVTQLYMNIVFQLSATNGNRVGASYSSFLLNVTYDNVTVGNTMFQAFEQDAHSTVSVESWMLVDNLNIFNHESELVADARSDRVPFQIAGRTDVRVHTVGFKSRFRVIKKLQTNPIYPSLPPLLACLNLKVSCLLKFILSSSLKGHCDHETV